MIEEVGRTKEIADRAGANALGSAFSPAKNVWDTLRSIPWKELCTGIFSQDATAAMNLVLDPRSCLGRLALMVYVIEKYFPELMPQVRCAEVTSDFFRALMIQQWGEIYSLDNPPPEGWIEEFLMYEEPHAIVTVNGRQFDPLFCVYAEANGCPIDGLAHPGVIEFSPWEAITTFRMVSEAFIEVAQTSKINKLREAEIVCPGTCLVRENLVGPLAIMYTEDKCQDKYDEARRLVGELCDIAPSARNLTYLRHYFGPSHSARSGYDPGLLAMLETAVWRSVL